MQDVKEEGRTRRILEIAVDNLVELAGNKLSGVEILTIFVDFDELLMNEVPT